jgi:hypothetical protein
MWTTCVSGNISSLASLCGYCSVRAISCRNACQSCRGPAPRVPFSDYPGSGTALPTHRAVWRPRSGTGQKDASPMPQPGLHLPSAPISHSHFWTNRATDRHPWSVERPAAPIQDDPDRPTADPNCPASRGRQSRRRTPLRRSVSCRIRLAARGDAQLPVTQLPSADSPPPGPGAAQHWPARPARTHRGYDRPQTDEAA